MLSLKNILKEEKEYVYYFAYGSNMDVNEFQINYKSAKALELVYLSDYKFKFDKYSYNDNSIVTDVVKENGNKVFGILYKLDINDISSLDKKEGGYIKKKSIVTDGNGNTYNAYFYSVVDKKNTKGLPSLEYSKKIINGLKDALKLGPTLSAELKIELKKYIKYILDITKP
jgi:cation transport regulator ChaC